MNQFFSKESYEHLRCFQTQYNCPQVTELGKSNEV